MSNVDALEVYPPLIFSPSREIRPPSRLYSLKPIGIGTPLTESLSSYLTRLATEHCLTPQKLIMGEIAPVIMGDKYSPEMLSKHSSFLFSNSDAKPAINGMREMTQVLTIALEKLTLRKDLRYF